MAETGRISFGGHDGRAESAPCRRNSSGLPRSWLWRWRRSRPGLRPQRNQLLASAQGNLKELKAKDQNHPKFGNPDPKSPDAACAGAPGAERKLDSAYRVEDKELEQSQKDLWVAQQRLGVALHEVQRLNASRAQPPTRVASRAPDPFRSRRTARRELRILCRRRRNPDKQPLATPEFSKPRGQPRFSRILHLRAAPFPKSLRERESTL